MSKCCSSDNADTNATDGTMKSAGASNERWSPALLDPLRRLCIGTWAWGGNTATWGADANATEQHQQAAFDAAMDAGVRFFDTAEIYSDGNSERVLGRFMRERRERRRAENGEVDVEPVYVASKFIPMPYHVAQSNVIAHCRASLERLGVEKMALYQIHGPAFSIRGVEVWAEGLADCVREGLVDAVGVSNYNSDQVRRTQRVLAKHGIPLASNQIEYSLLHTLPEQTGLLRTCKELGVTVLAYSPLAMGRLCGKYTSANPPPGNRNKFGDAPWPVITALNAKLRDIGDAQTPIQTPAQVALRWCMAKGTVPICGARNAAQAAQNAAACGGVGGGAGAASSAESLSAADVAMLDAAAYRHVDSWFSWLWQGSSD